MISIKSFNVLITILLCLEYKTIGKFDFKMWLISEEGYYTTIYTYEIAILVLIVVPPIKEKRRNWKKLNLKDRKIRKPSKCCYFRF